jgi:hypothetical protein
MSKGATFDRAQRFRNRMSTAGRTARLSSAIKQLQVGTTKGSHMRKRTVKQTLSLAERCKAAALTKLDAAAKLAPGPERNALERIAKELENVRAIERLLDSSEIERRTRADNFLRVT